MTYTNSAKAGIGNFFYKRKKHQFGRKFLLWKKNIVRNANFACKQDAIAAITDLELKESLSMDEVVKFTARIFSDKNIGQDGKPNYTKDEVHWLIHGRIIKCNRPRKN